MGCFNPILVREDGVNKNGKKKLVFSGAKDQRSDSTFKLACGKCIGCLRNRAREWAIRCVHENQTGKKGCFITLTYNKENLPKDGSVNVAHFQKFIKRLRKSIQPQKIRYFHCGEYGKKLLRPHYHALIYGYDFPDKRLHSRNGLKQKIFRSAHLERLWPFGFSTIGEISQQSAEYVARYSLKKVYGENGKKHYGDKRPEYVTMSRRPGLGRSWYEKYKSDIYPKGILFYNGYSQIPPKYYDSLYEKEDGDLQAVKEDRIRRAARVRAYDIVNGTESRVNDNDSIRLGIKERIVEKRMKLLKRYMEEK